MAFAAAMAIVHHVSNVLSSSEPPPDPNTESFLTHASDKCMIRASAEFEGRARLVALAHRSRSPVSADLACLVVSGNLYQMVLHDVDMRSRIWVCERRTSPVNEALGIYGSVQERPRSRIFPKRDHTRVVVLSRWSRVAFVQASCSAHWP